MAWACVHGRASVLDTCTQNVFMQRWWEACLGGPSRQIKRSWMRITAPDQALCMPLALPPGFSSPSPQRRKGWGHPLSFTLKDKKL